MTGGGRMPVFAVIMAGGDEAVGCVLTSDHLISPARDSVEDVKKMLSDGAMKI